MQQSSEQFEEDTVNYTDFDTLLYPPQFAADCFGLTTRRLKDIEDENGIEIRRVPRGTVTSRAYTLRDIFDIAALRRAKATQRDSRGKLSSQLSCRKAGQERPQPQSILLYSFSLQV